jgi:hypothetical protein
VNNQGKLAAVEPGINGVEKQIDVTTGKSGGIELEKTGDGQDV